MKANLPPPISIRHLLRKYNLRPNKKLGQNFLVDEQTLRKIIESADISKNDVVLEIGPGLGNLTRYLAIDALHVIAVELDHKFLKPLHEVLAPFDNVSIIIGDILEQNIENLLSKVTSKPVNDFIVVANIPYYITSAVVRHLLDTPTRPDRMILTVQREVAMRICAEPPDMSLLSISVQIFGKPKISTKIPAGAFYPVPKVDSAVIRVNIFSDPIISPHQVKNFFRLTKAGFGQKRKNLRNSLSAGLGISKSQVETLMTRANIDYRRRAETLSINEWRELSIYLEDSENSSVSDKKET